MAFKDIVLIDVECNIFVIHSISIKNDKFTLKLYVNCRIFVWARLNFLISMAKKPKYVYSRTLKKKKKCLTFFFVSKWLYSYLSFFFKNTHLICVHIHISNIFYKRPHKIDRRTDARSKPKKPIWRNHKT